MKKIPISIRGVVNARAEILAETKLQSITDFSPDDIFIVGYPKSGNTWMQCLLAGLIFGIDTRFAPDSLVQDLVPDVYFKRFYRRHLTPTFFKTHDLPRERYRRVIYLVRDGRDVMVSFFHHLAALGHCSDYSKLVNGEGIFPYRWHEHVESWLANPYGAELITISYENLQRNTVAELRKICVFAGLEREQAALEFVAQTTTFGIMGAREKKFGWDNPVWPKDKPFLRRGKIGSFNDEMPHQDLAAFMKVSMPTLSRLGYC
jgi:hypothetical protein